jgi:putative hemin transport protein
MDISNEFIRDTFAEMRQEGKSRHRDIAARLKISEGELIAAHVGLIDSHNTNTRVTRLRGEWGKIIAGLEALGDVMALSRNSACVHEKIGVYRKASQHENMGLVLGEEIDLRLFYRQWSHGFAVDEKTPKGTQRSLQFFDSEGTAIHKVFLTPSSNVSAFTELVRKFSTEAQLVGIELVSAPDSPAEKPDEAIDVAGLRAAWAALQDTHDFFGLLKKFAVTRTQALRLAGSVFVKPVEKDFCKKLLKAASQSAVPIMVFVGNAGIIQIHSGPIRKFVVMETWINVLDPSFNLHLREDQIASSWIVKKPTSDGTVTSLEIFDQQGNTIAMFFGARKPGIPEQAAWREIIDNCIEESAPCVN